MRLTGRGANARDAWKKFDSILAATPIAVCPRNHPRDRRYVTPLCATRSTRRKSVKDAARGEGEGEMGAAREVANAVLCIPNAYSPILTHRMHGQLIYGRNKPPAFPINRKASQRADPSLPRMFDTGIVPLVVVRSWRIFMETREIRRGLSLDSS